MARYRKRKIPKAVRESIWLAHCGRVYDAKCLTPWCQNTITVNDFQAGHKIPESKGGPTTFENLIPLCSRCNLSMGSAYTFDQWAAISGEQAPLPPRRKPSWLAGLCCFTAAAISPLPSSVPPSTIAIPLAQLRDTSPPAPASRGRRRGQTSQPPPNS